MTFLPKSCIICEEDARWTACDVVSTSTTVWTDYLPPTPCQSQPHTPQKGIPFSKWPHSNTNRRTYFCERQLTSTSSPSWQRSFMQEKTSSHKLASRPRRVWWTRVNTARWIGSGRLCACFLMDFSESCASWKVKPLLPVYLQLHNKLLHKIVRSKNDLKRKNGGVSKRQVKTVNGENE